MHAPAPLERGDISHVKFLSNTHVGLAEALLLVAAGRVGQVGGVLALHGDVVLEGDVADLDVIEGPNPVDTQSEGFGDAWGGVIKHSQKSGRGRQVAFESLTSHAR